MIVWISTDEDGRIVSSTTYEQFSTGMTQVELPDDFDFSKQLDYIYKDGQLTCDNYYTNGENAALAAQKQREKEDAQMPAAVRMFVRANSDSFTDEQALAVSSLFEEWSVGVEYKRNQIIRHDDEVYRIGQDHTSQEQWVPGADGTTALYSHIVIDEEGYENWKQWDGITGLYNRGQVVRDPEDEKLYESKIDNSTYGPPHEMPYYWELYVEQE